MSQTDKGIDDLPEDDETTATNVTGEAKDEEINAEDAANESEVTEPATDIQKDGNAGGSDTDDRPADSGNETERGTAEYDTGGTGTDTGGSDTGTGAGTYLSTNVDTKLSTLTEEENVQTEEETTKRVGKDGIAVRATVPEQEQQTETEEEENTTETGEEGMENVRESLKSMEESGAKQGMVEEQVEKEDRQKSVLAGEAEERKIEAENKRVDEEQKENEKRKAEKELKRKEGEGEVQKSVPVPVEPFRDIVYESVHGIGYEEVLEVDSDLAKAFAQQIGLYDEESEEYDEKEEEEEDWGEETVIRDADLLISQPTFIEQSALPRNLLEFRYSFGFDCAKPYNLCVLDPDTVVLTAGNMLLFLKISTNAVTFRRSSSGQGLGFIAKHPLLPHFAVGENGKEPHIIIYEWPAISLVALLRHGTRRSYSHLDYSPTGELLCSQGGSPDYLFTVWNWKKEKIMLRTRSSNTDVLNSRFSLYMPGHITTGGMGHIKFWKMCKTFTGLKLKGETGRFGKTEISDVLGIYGMPDEKVVSGCDWGNILVWEAGLIKFEVTRKNRLKCHDGAITQFEFQNGELMTAGKDGFVKSWYYETIDMADPPDEDRFVEVEPMFELEVADHHGPASIISMARVDPTLRGDTSWYAQDANGGIWLLNLAMTANATPPKRLYTCHSGQIIGLQTSPISEHFASFDTQGKLHLWDMNTSQLLAIKLTPFPGSSLLWLPEDVASCGCVLLAGLSDGGVRAYAVNLADASHSTRSVILDPGSERFFSLIQFIKPHTAPVLFMDISIDHKHLLTVSSDLTAFVFTVEKAGVFCNLRPVGFVRIPSVPTYLRRNALNPIVFYVGCVKGEIVEITVPENPTHNTDVSYEFTETQITRSLQTKSIKSQILRDLYLEEQQRRKDVRLEEKMEKLLELKKENPGLEIDEEQFLADSEAEEDLLPLYIPDNVSSINIISPVRGDPDAMWVILGGYDCGYIYKYRFGHEGPEWWSRYLESGMDEISVGLTNANRTLMYGGLGDGTIVVGVVQSEIGPTNDVWSIGMHHGRVSRLVLSRNEDFLISAGEDVNIFTYSINVPSRFRTSLKPTIPVPKFVPPPADTDAYNVNEPSLEQASGKKESDRKMKEASAKKLNVEHILFNLAEQYHKLKRRNLALPKSQALPREALELDPRITDDRHRSIAEEAEDVKHRHIYNLEKAKLRFKKLQDFFTKSLSHDTIVVKGIKKNVSVTTIRHCILADTFALAKQALERKLREEAKKKKGIDMDVEVEEADNYVPALPTPVESFLRGISAFEHRFSSRLRRLLEKYQSRAAKKERRKLEWAAFMAKMPDVNRNDPEDEARIAEAEQTIGDYKLKSGSKYKVPKHLIATTMSKCQELLTMRENLDKIICTYNESVHGLHQKKLAMIQKLNERVGDLKRIHEELKPNLHKPIPQVPSLADEKDANKTAHFWFNKSAVAEERDRMSTKKKAVDGKTVIPEHYYNSDPLAEAIFASGVQLVYPEHFLKGAECEDVSGEIPDMHLINTSTDASIFIELSGRDDTTTPYEKEIRLKRVLRRTWEQDTIIKEMTQRIADFDNEVEKMSEKRLVALRDCILIHLRIITLTQELDIIKASESREDFLMSRVTDKQLEKKAVLQQIATLQSRLETRNKGILRCQDKQKQTLSSFFEAIGENPFKDYLRRIFKKKYKPPRADDESSSESSSSTSSEDDDDADAESVDSKELQTMRFDENVCPPGCPRDLYDLTFALRSERHDAEKEISEHQKASEVLKREQDSWNKKLKVIETGLQDNMDDLDLFQREKQQRLNEVDTVVVIRLSQMRHVKPDGTFIPMKDTLVFDTTMLSYLGKRVGQLNVEANEERERHRKNRRHLYRMVKDVHFMEDRLKQLREGIVEAQYNKFGQLVKLEDLEAALLRRYIYEMRLNVNEIKKDFQGLIKSIKDTVRQRFSELIEAVENNTDLQNLLLTLTEERNKLFLRNEANIATLTRSTAGTIDEKEFQEDIDKLREISRKMSDKRNALLQELIRLRQKGTAPASVELMERPENEAGPGPPGYHARCVPDTSRPPPWPPRVIPGFDKLRLWGVLKAPEKPPTPPASPIVDMWEQLLQDMGVEDQTYWPDHTDPSNKNKLSVESIGEGFVFQTLHDLPPVNEEEVLTANFVRDDTAPLFTVVGDRVHVVGQPEDETEVPEDAGSMDDYDIEKVESSSELFRRVPSSGVEGAIEDLLDTLSSSTGEKSADRKEPKKSIDIHARQTRSASQSDRSRRSNQTTRSRSCSQSRQSHESRTNSQEHFQGQNEK